jgi:NAD(P)-dependent dehydrogenase (short-subunit alcohol dehydrogenase family)
MMERTMVMKVWFVTGASRGFGALITAEALKRGDAVVATARKPKAIADRFGELPNLLPIALDVTHEEQAHEAAKAAVERFGRIDVLVNNAGYGFLATIEEATTKGIEDVFRTNVFGLLSVTRAVLPHMRRQRAGYILNMSSVAGFAPYACYGIYCSTKFAVEGLSETLALELKPLGIHVTAVEPGFFRTEFFDQSSLAIGASKIGDYRAIMDGMLDITAKANGAQPGNPLRLAEVLIEFVNEKNPPVRLQLGSDTVAMLEKKLAEIHANLERYRSLSLSTDFGV